MTRVPVIALIVALAVSGPAGAGEDDAILVTARRLPTEAERSGTSISSLSAEEIEDRQSTSLADALREIPGLWVTRGGGVGSPTSIFIRGAGSNQTKVLLDGIPMNDPTLGGQYNAFDLTPDGLGSVEVLRGSQSTLYGTEAIGGVVQLVSRSYLGPVSVRLLGEGGGRGTGRAHLEVGGGDETVSGGFFTSWFTTENEVTRNAFDVLTVGGRLVVRPVDDLEIGLTLRHSESRAEEPYDFGNPLPDDENIGRERRTLLAGLTASWRVLDGVTLGIQGSRLEVKSRLVNGPDTPGAPDELTSESKARVDDLTLTATVELLRLAGVDGEVVRDRLLAGFEYQEEESRNETGSPFGATKLEDVVRTRSWFFQEEVTVLGRVDATVGVRITDNDVFGDEVVPAYALQYRHIETDTTLAASYSMGFRAPTPIEYADPWVGNADLTEEKSRSVDVGVRQRLLDGDLTLGATWFRLSVDDLIAYDPASFRLENFNRTRTTGVEATAAWRIDGNWSVGGSYTHQDPKNLDAPDGRDDGLPGRARDFGSVWVGYERSALRVLASAVVSGGYEDTDIVGPDQDARRDPGRKFVVNVAASCMATETVRIFARVENLLDDTYVESETGPRAPGIGLFAGIDLRF